MRVSRILISVLLISALVLVSVGKSNAEEGGMKQEWPEVSQINICIRIMFPYIWYNKQLFEIALPGFGVISHTLVIFALG